MTSLTFSDLPDEASPSEPADQPHLQRKTNSFPFSSLSQLSFSSMIPSGCFELDEHTSFSIDCSSQPHCREHSNTSTQCEERGPSWKADVLKLSRSATVDEVSPSPSSMQEDLPQEGSVPSPDDNLLCEITPNVGLSCDLSNEPTNSHHSTSRLDKNAPPSLRKERAPEVPEPSIIAQILRKQQATFRDNETLSPPSKSREPTTTPVNQPGNFLHTTDTPAQAVKKTPLPTKRKYSSNSSRGSIFGYLKKPGGVAKPSRPPKLSSYMLSKMQECMKVLRADQLKRMATAFQCMAKQLEIAGTDEVQSHCLRQSEEISRLENLFSREMDYVQAKYESGYNLESIITRGNGGGGG